MAWAIFASSFIEEIVRTKGGALAGTIPEPTTESVRAEFVAAAQRAVRRELGEDAPVEVELTDDLGDVLYFQVVRAVEAPRARDEISLLALRRVDPEAAASGKLRVPLYYTENPGERATAPRLEERYGALLPLPIHSKPLWDRLTEELNALVLRYFPAPEFAPGTLGALLASGGGWTRGLTVKRGDLEIVLESAYLDFIRLRVTGGWIDYGFVTVFKKAGVEIFRGRGHAADRLGEGRDAPWLSPLSAGDNDGSVLAWGQLPASAEPAPDFVAGLQALVDNLAAGKSANLTTVKALLVAAIEPPIRGGLWDWMEKALPPLVNGHVVELTYDDVRVRFEVNETYPPQTGLVYFGDSGVGLVASASDRAASDRPGESLQTGSVGPEALTLRGPETEDEERALRRIAATFLEWLDVHLAHHVADRGIEFIDSGSYFYAFSGYFPLVQLLEQRIRWGDPGEPPVPAFDDDALDRAGRSLKPIVGEERRAQAIAALKMNPEHVIALFSVRGWTVALLDDLTGFPFGSYCGIEVLPPDGGDAVNVMMVDAWNPPARTVVDGDAFAFRRFVSWLRGGIVRGGYDLEVRYAGSDPGDEEELGPQPHTLSLSDWLLFGLPDTGDRFLVDWRAQWHIVNAVRGIDSFSGIYGFTGAYMEKLRAYDIPVWRRFLREVIDPRFPPSG